MGYEDELIIHADLMAILPDKKPGSTPQLKLKERSKHPIIEHTSSSARLVTTLPFVVSYRTGNVPPLGILQLSGSKVYEKFDVREFGFDLPSAKIRPITALHLGAREILGDREKDFFFFTEFKYGGIVRLLLFPRTREAFEEMEDVLESIVSELGPRFREKDITITPLVSRKDKERASISERTERMILSSLLGEGISEYAYDSFFLRPHSGATTGVDLHYRFIIDKIKGRGSMLIGKLKGESRIRIEFVPGIIRKLSLILKGAYLMRTRGYVISFEPKSSYLVLKPGVDLSKIDEENPVPITSDILGTFEDILSSDDKERLREDPKRFAAILNSELSSSYTKAKHAFYTIDGRKIREVFEIFPKTETFKHLPMRRAPRKYTAFDMSEAMKSEFRMLARIEKNGVSTVKLIPLRAITLKRRVEDVHGGFKYLSKLTKDVVGRMRFSKEALHEIDNAIRAGLKDKTKGMTITFGKNALLYSPNTAFHIVFSDSIVDVFRNALKSSDVTDVSGLFRKKVLSVNVKYVAGNFDVKIKPEDVAMNVNRVLKEVIKHGPYKPLEKPRRLIVVPLIIYVENKPDRAGEYLETLMNEVPEVLKKLTGVERNVELRNRENPFLEVKRTTKTDEKELSPFIIDSLRRIKELVEGLAKTLSPDDVVLFLAFEDDKIASVVEDDITKTSMSFIDYKYVILYYFFRYYESGVSRIPIIQFLRPKKDHLEKLKESKDMGILNVSQIRSALIQLARKAGAFILGPTDNPSYSALIRALILEDPELLEKSKLEDYLRKVFETFRSLEGNENDREKILSLGMLNLYIFAGLISARDLIEGLEEEKEEEEEEEESVEDLIKRKNISAIFFVSALLPDGTIYTVAEPVKSEAEKDPAMSERIMNSLLNALFDKVIYRMSKMGFVIKRRARGRDKFDNIFLYILAPDILRKTGFRVIPRVIVDYVKSYDSEDSSAMFASLTRVITYAIQPETETITMIHFGKTGMTLDVSKGMRASSMYILSPRKVIVQNSIGREGLPRCIEVEFLPEFTRLRENDLSVHHAIYLRSALGGYLMVLLSRFAPQNIAVLKLPILYYNRKIIMRTLKKIFARRKSLYFYFKRIRKKYSDFPGISEILFPNATSKEDKEFFDNEFATTLIKAMKGMFEDARRWV